jgi:hypothetical protein
MTYRGIVGGLRKAEEALNAVINGGDYETAIKLVGVNQSGSCVAQAERALVNIQEILSNIERQRHG